MSFLGGKRPETERYERLGEIVAAMLTDDRELLKEDRLSEISEAIAADYIMAFDENGTRLGRGGGYYDRYLPRCARAKAILAAFEPQRLPRVPCEAHDLSFSLLVTEKGVFRK